MKSWNMEGFNQVEDNATTVDLFVPSLFSTTTSDKIKNAHFVLLEKGFNVMSMLL